MRFRGVAAVVLIGLGANVPAFAADGKDQDPLLQPEPQVLFRGLIQESDVSLLFDYLRSALAAAAEGREAPPPPAALQERAQMLGNELRLRGALAALALLNALEASAKQALREPAAPPRPLPPPFTPYTPASTD